jgi:nitrogen fixation NifU-like protein
MFEYSPIILDHFHHPRHVGILNKDACDVGSGQLGDADSTCIMQLQVRVNSKQIITEACFKVHGCVSAIATLSWLCDYLREKSLDEAAAVSSTFIIEALQLKPQKLFCALIAEDVLKLAIENYRKKISQTSL